MSQLIRAPFALRAVYVVLLLVAAQAADASIVDDFGDGDDTTPAWSHLDPTLGATFDASSLSYLISVGATEDALDPARAFSLREDESFRDVVVAADLVGFDDVADHRYGIAARSTSSLAATHDGYALVLTAPGALELLQLDAEVATTLASVPVAVSSGTDYRLVLSVTGSSPAQLTGKLFAASDLAHPIATVRYTDSLAPIYTSGFTGFLVADGGALQDQALGASFDDFFASAPGTDADADGLSDGAELSIGTDPSDPDTDDDGLLDGTEFGTGVFGAQITISTQADGPRMVMTADMDGDGDLDVLSASYLDGTIAWHENDGTPLVGIWPEYPITTIADRPTSLFPADVDGDGDTDVVAASNLDYVVSWYENDGTPAVGTWPEHPISETDSGALSYVNRVSAADMDNDGDMDLLTLSGTNDAFAWYENDGTPADGSWTPYPIATQTSSFIPTDIDGDGDTDPLTTSFFNWIAWWENDGTPAVGAFPRNELAVNVGFPIRWVQAADFDGDGDTDVLSRSLTDFIAWYENDGTPAVGGWTAYPISSGGGSSISSFPWDVDGDGDMDVLAAENLANEFVWYENDGSPALGAWTRRVFTTAINYPEWVVAADIDGDGDADAVSASFLDDRIAWYPQQNVADPLDPDSDDDGLLDGFEVTFGFDPLLAGEQGQDPDADGLTNLQEQVAGTNPNVSDTDGDGLLDGFEVAYGFDPLLAGEQGQDPDADGLVNFEEQAAGANPNLADTDGDGLLDGAEVNTHGTNPIAADTDGDGLSDSAELNTHGTSPLLSDTDGDGLGDSAELYTYGTSPLLSDTDGDGLVDGFETAYGFDPLLPGQQAEDPDTDGLTNLQEQDAGTNPTQADSDGDGLSDSAELYTHGTSPTLADTDADGINDGSELSIGTNPLDADTDDDGLSDGNEIATGADPFDADTDDDGLLDGAEIGTGVFGAQITISTQADGPRMVMTADMDGDGDLDVLSASYLDNTIAWHENDGTPLVGVWPEHLITTIADRPTCLFPADVDGDGDVDVVAASNLDYVVSWYENDGTPAVGAWPEHPITATDSGAQSFVNKVNAADMDNDGDMDLLALSGTNDAFVWYENDGTPAVGVWTAHPIANATTAMIATDIDGDGNTDGLSTSGFNWIAWWENDGTPAIGPLPRHELAVNVGFPIRWVHAADFDGDGDTDVLSRSLTDFIAWYENDGTPAVGDWTAHPISSGAGSSISSFPWDVDGDGDTDVLAAEDLANEVVWYENDGTPALGAWTRHVISISAYPEWVVAADIDGDGDADAVSGSWYDDRIAWHPQQNVADPLDPDSDDDGLLDGFEVTYGFDPLVAGEQAQDPDADGLTNLQEQAAGTNPNLSDTDGDGLLDSFEVSSGFDPLVPGDEALDPDADGLTNLAEQAAGTDPIVSDTDGDGLLDGAEVNTHGTNPILTDTDGDGLGDGVEVNVYGTSPILSDTDGDAVQDGADNCRVTANPTQSDVGGVLNGPPDGVGDACQCGDVDDSGIVDSADVVAYRNSLADPDGLPLTPAGVAKCSVIGSAGPCEIVDVSVIQRALEAEPLLPGIAQVCSAARGP